MRLQSNNRTIDHGNIYYVAEAQCNLRTSDQYHN
jgi:hypothetical protein